jgi:hypothetical protein
MKTILLYISLYILTANLATAQLSELAKKCNYEEDELTLTINGWDFDRIDYNHAAFTNVVGSASLATLSYSGERDTAEFGYPWFYYKDSNGENWMRFSGILEGADGNYQGKKTINSFQIKNRNNFNVNGLRVGDPKSDVVTTFSNVCYKDNGNHIYIHYRWYTVSFIIDPATNLVTQMNLFCPI